MQQIAQGAEAVIYKNQNSILKDRISKSYRHKQLDEQLRKTRTRREARILEKLKEFNFPAPRLKNSDQNKLEIDYINGKLVKNILEKNFKKLAPEIGRKIALLHAHDIVHGDLTTSNMILNNEINFIDFGLSFFSRRIEDKAVDLHLLDRALESKHHTIYPKVFNLVINEYKKHYSDSVLVLKRFEEVKKRGRNKAKY